MRPILVATVAVVVVVGTTSALYRMERSGAEADAGDSIPTTLAEPAPRPSPVSRGMGDASRRPSAQPLWRAVNESEAQRKPRYADDWSKEGRALVDVSGAVAMASAWRVGDAVAIEVPQLGERFESRIERIDEGPDGRSRSVRGLIPSEDGPPRRFVVTVGPMHVFAYLDTARGPYELVGDNRLAWLLPSSSMMAGWDFSKPDYLLPERDGVGGQR